MLDSVPNPVQTSLVVTSAAMLAVALSMSHSLQARLRLWSSFIIIIGTSLAAGALVWHAISRGRWFPLEDNFEALGWLGVMLACCVMYVQKVRPVAGLDWFVYPIVIVLLLAAAYFGREVPRDYARTAWSTVHRVSAYAGALSLAIAGAVGAMYLLASRRLRSKHLDQHLPMASLERLETATQHALTLGWPLFTIGLVTGLLWGLQKTAEGERHAATFFGPKVLLAVGAWVVFALALHTPMNPSFRGRKSAVLSLIGLVLMAATLVAVQYMPGGHG